MVKNIDFSISILVRSSLYLLVDLFDRSFVHLFVPFVFVVLLSFGHLIVCLFARMWSTRPRKNEQLVHLVFWSFVRLFECF